MNSNLLKNCNIFSSQFYLLNWYEDDKHLPSYVSYGCNYQLKYNYMRKKRKHTTAFLSSSVKDTLYEFRIPGQQIYFLLNYLKFSPIFFLPRVFLMRSWPLSALLCFLYLMPAFKILKNLLPSSPLPWYGCKNNTSCGFLHICLA